MAKGKRAAKRIAKTIEQGAGQVIEEAVEGAAKVKTNLRINRGKAVKEATKEGANNVNKTLRAKKEDIDMLKANRRESKRVERQINREAKIETLSSNNEIYGETALDIKREHTKQMRAANSSEARNLKEQWNMLDNEILKNQRNIKILNAKTSKAPKIKNDQNVNFKKLNSRPSKVNSVSKPPTPNGLSPNANNWVRTAVGTGIVGGLVLNMSNNRGQQSNSQLYGQ